MKLFLPGSMARWHSPRQTENPVSMNPDPRRLRRRHALRSLQSGIVWGALLGFAPRGALADDQPLAVVGSWLIRSGPADKPLPITSLMRPSTATTADSRCTPWMITARQSAWTATDWSLPRESS